MAVPMEARSGKLQLAFSPSLGTKCEKSADIHCIMKRQYRDTLSFQQIHEWHRKVKSKCQTWPMQLVLAGLTANMSDTNTEVEQMTWENQ